MRAFWYQLKNIWKDERGITTVEVILLMVDILTIQKGCNYC